MDLGLEGKIVVVTGASKGIGLAVTTRLAAEGATVVAGAREISDDVRALAPSVLPVEVDLSYASGPATLIDAAITAFGGLDALINNVGATRPRPDGFLSITDDDWLQTLTINLMAAVRTTRAAIPHLLERGGGAIVSTVSVNAFLPDPLVMDYSAAKAALASFSKSLSKEYGPRGIRVNTVSPGPVATDLWLGKDGVAQTVGRANGLDPDAVAKGAAAQGATGRFTTPDEVADLIVLLASSRAANMTGSDVVIDGGLVQTL